MFAPQPQTKKTSEEEFPDLYEPDGEQKAFAEDLKDDLDELMDEIDSLLETNAQEFVENFTQRGGE